MSTLREHIKAMIGHPSPLIVDAHGEAALKILDASREITEKVTHELRLHGEPGHITVTVHKARVVIDP